MDDIQLVIDAHAEMFKHRQAVRQRNRIARAIHFRPHRRELVIAVDEQ